MRCEYRFAYYDFALSPCLGVLKSDNTFYTFKFGIYWLKKAKVNYLSTFF